MGVQGRVEILDPAEKVASNSATSCPFFRNIDASSRVDSGEYGFIRACCLAS